MERGILDKTHLQFFTRSTARAMLSSAGLSPKAIRATPVPIEQISSSKWINSAGGLFQRAMIRLLPTLFAFQWIFIAEPNDA
jgi:hypothetical protein